MCLWWRLLHNTVNLRDRSISCGSLWVGPRLGAETHEGAGNVLSHYLLLVAVEEAFKNLKGDLAIRLIFHQLEARIEAHVFIAFLAYCLHVTLARRCMRWRPG